MSDNNDFQHDAENVSQAGDEMSTADAVSLFTSSLNSALKKQKQEILAEIQPTRKIFVANAPASADIPSSGHFEFKQEGTKFQFNFNSERISNLKKIDSLISDHNFEDAKSVIKSEVSALRQRNKILKIADKHGWDTLHEYLDDPLADDNEDATRLRGAIIRAGRKRKRPVAQRSSFNPRSFFSWLRPRLSEQKPNQLIKLSNKLRLLLL